MSETTTGTVTLVPTTKRDARRRWDAGETIGVTQERYPDGLTGNGCTRAAQGWTFDELVEHSTDTRRPSSVYWYRVAETPAPVQPLPVVPPHTRTLREGWAAGTFSDPGSPALPTPDGSGRWLTVIGSANDSRYLYPDRAMAEERAASLRSRYVPSAAERITVAYVRNAGGYFYWTVPVPAGA
jgi:hypothetical protein